jgi:hypothetical protein
MDNQHRKILGYRELTQDEIDLMNEIKAFGVQVGEMILRIEIAGSATADPRWVGIAKTNLQQGLMALTRAVTKPEFF